MARWVLICGLGWLLSCAGIWTPSTADSTGAADGAASAFDASAAEADLGTAVDCDGPPAGAPAAMPYPFWMNGQQAWSHDAGDPSGYFHTYDALQVGGPGDVAHKVHVFLPRGYGRCSGPYPVVYMNDGDTSFWPGGGGGKSWRVQDVLSTLYAGRRLRQVIVVAIVPVDRDVEYSHVEVAPDRGCCGADRYVRYIADAVRPFINASYRTRRDRDSTLIVGSSRGGLSAFYLATRRPDVFGQAICMSSSFWAGLDPVFGGSYPGGPLGAAPIVAQVQTTLHDRMRRPRLWIDWGLVRRGGAHNSVIEDAATRRGREMQGILTGTYGYVGGRDLFALEDPVGEHDELSWGRRLRDALPALWP